MKTFLVEVDSKQVYSLVGFVHKDAVRLGGAGVESLSLPLGFHLWRSVEKHQFGFGKETETLFFSHMFQVR